MDSKNFQSKVVALIKETWLTSWELIRITIPIAVITKILDEFGLISYIGLLLEPVMSLVGLPGSLGIVWATGMLTNLYAGIAVFAAIAPELGLTAGQVTVLCSMMLFAHSLPIELSVTKRAGVSIIPIAILRIGGAIIFGYLLNICCIGFGFWQEEALMLFTPSPSAGGIFTWITGLIQNLGLIVLIIFCIVLGMRGLRAIGFLRLIEVILAPVLPLFGMSKKAAPITVVGMIMGIGYGGALIVRETATGKMEREEVFNAMALMGLCHGLVEDTLLMVAIGGKIGGVFWLRTFFALLVIFLMVKLLSNINRHRITRLQM